MTAERQADPAGSPTDTATWAYASADTYEFMVTDAWLATPVIREVWLTPAGADHLPYRPGQYVLLRDAALRLPPRSYSIANAPRRDGRLSLLVTRIEGGPTSAWVHDELVVGDQVSVEGPYGMFVADAGRTGPVLLLAAGSGLAPCRALAQAMLAAEPARAVTLACSVRTATDAIDDVTFHEWEATRPGFRYLITFTRDPRPPIRGRLPGLLAELVGDLRGWEVFAAGPPGFVLGCADAAEALGADPADIATEEFFTEELLLTDYGAPPEISARANGDE